MTTLLRPWVLVFCLQFKEKVFADKPAPKMSVPNCLVNLNAWPGQVPGRAVNNKKYTNSGMEEGQVREGWLKSTELSVDGSRWDFFFFFGLIIYFSWERMSNPSDNCAKWIYKHVFLADGKMANISLDVHTFIAQNLPKYCFQCSLDYTFLSLSVSSIIF